MFAAPCSRRHRGAPITTLKIFFDDRGGDLDAAHRGVGEPRRRGRQNFMTFQGACGSRRLPAAAALIGHAQHNLATAVTVVGLRRLCRRGRIFMLL